MKITKEDILKYGTRDEVEFLTEEKITPETVREGDPATLSVGSDSYPFTVIEIRRGGKQIDIQACSTKALKSPHETEDQEWEITPNPNGKIKTANWSNKRQAYLSGGIYVYVGNARMYRDPSF